MCGRIALYTPPARLARFFHARQAAGPGEGSGSSELPESESTVQVAPSWNVAPSRRVLAVVPARDRSERLLVPLQWGLVPFWAKDPSIGNRMINARAESVASHSAYRRAFERRRCLVVADGFYEWKGTEVPAASGRTRRMRQPWYFQRVDGTPLAFAGLWESWRPAEDPGPVLRTCTIITTGAGPDVAPVHDRMPVVVEADDWDEWIGIDEARQQALLSLLGPSNNGTLVGHPVDPRVNRPEVDEPGLVEPLPDGTRAPSVGAAAEPGAPQRDGRHSRAAEQPTLPLGEEG